MCGDELFGCRDEHLQSVSLGSAPVSDARLELLGVSPEPVPQTRPLSWGTSCFHQLCKDQPTSKGFYRVYSVSCKTFLMFLILQR